MGIGFGDIQESLEAEEYPMSSEWLLEKYGDYEITHANGSKSLRDVLGVMRNDTYNSADEIHQAVLNMVGDEAVGRKAYTDREPNARETEYEPQSF